MKYCELLELYKNNELNTEETEKVRMAIEQQEAISNFLFDEAEQEDDLGENIWKESPNAGNSAESELFMKQINQRIHRAFLKFGIGAGVFAAALTLFVVMALPKIVDEFYYDPGENSEQLSLDMAVYTEAVMPGYYRENVQTQSRGYGNYDVNIYQNVSYTGNFVNVAGKIEKGKLILYNPNVLRRPTGNAFAWFQMEGDSRDSLKDLIDKKNKTNYCAAGDKEQAAEAVENLNDGEKYMVYVTLDKMMRYEDFIDYLETSPAGTSLAEPWCAVCTENGIEDIDTSENGEEFEEGSVKMSFFRAENIGFHCSMTSSTMLEWDKERYPSLLLWDEEVIENGLYDELQEKIQTEEFMKEHFISMMRYLSEQKEFLSMMNENSECYKNAADYVEENGLMVYGYAGIAEKEDILTLMEEEEVYQVYTKSIQ